MDSPSARRCSVVMSHEHSVYDLEQLEALRREVPLAFQPLVSVHSVQFDACVRAASEWSLSTIEPRMFVAGQLSRSGFWKTWRAASGYRSTVSELGAGSYHRSGHSLVGLFPV